LQGNEDAEHDEGKILQDLKKATDDGDEAEIKRLQKILDNLQHEVGKTDAVMQDEKDKKKDGVSAASDESILAADGSGEGAGDDPRPPTPPPIDDPDPDVTVIKKGPESKGDKMIFLKDVSAASKISTETYANATRVFAEDTGDLVNKFADKPVKKKEHAWNFFLGFFVKQTQNVTPTKTTMLNADGGYGGGAAGESMRVITDPDSDSLNLLGTGAGGMTASSIGKMYQRLSGRDVQHVRERHLLRVDMNFRDLAIGPVLPDGRGMPIGNQAAVLSGSIFTDQGTAIMSEERAVRLNCGLKAFRQNLTNPSELIRMYGKNGNAFKVKGTADALFTQSYASFTVSKSPLSNWNMT